MSDIDEGNEQATATAETGAKEDNKSSADNSNVESTEFEDLVAEQDVNSDEHPNMDVIMEIPVVISMEVGKTNISIRNLLKLSQGSVVELDRFAGDPLDVYVNGTLIAHGEVVVVNEKFGIRLTDVIRTAERIKKLGDL